MNNEEVIRLVQEKKISSEEALRLASKHARRLSEIEVDLTSEPLKCGFPSIEEYQYILDKVGNLVIMAARPGNGKTALACQIGLNVAKWGRTLYFSLEMSAESLSKRLLAIASDVAIKNLGFSINAEKVKAALVTQKQYRFDIIDDLSLGVNEIISKTLDEHRLEPINLVIIDYIGNVRVDNEQRHLSIKEATGKLRNLIAIPLKIPVLVLAQMNRDVDRRRAFAANKSEVRPSMSDIADSAGIEQNADCVLFLERPCLTDPTAKKTLFRVYANKNRHGEVKDFEMDFIPSQTKFIDFGF